MALTDPEALAAFIAAAPAMADSSPRVLQGLLATSRTLNNYGYRFHAMPNETDHNWGAFSAPPGVPCSPPETLAVELGGGQSLCVITFPSDVEGVNTFIDAMSADQGIASAMVSGNVMSLVSALRSSPAFSQQANALYGDNLGMYLALALTKVSEGMGVAPDWHDDMGTRVDVALANANTPDGGGGDSPTIQVEPPETTATDAGMSAGTMIIAGLTVGAFGYGLYKLAMRGPR